jgi:predicted N-acetyltransferase YhbS
MLDVRSATMADVEAIARVLARAFQDDPGTIVIEPDAERRRTGFERFFRTFATASIRDGGDVVVPADTVRGVACWFGPDAHGPTEAGLAEAGMGLVADTFGAEATGRLVAMVGKIEAQHTELMSGPHLRLEFFGVDPASQGRGIGGALADHGHRRADALGLPCYLETFTETNIAYYGHRGYRVIATYPVGEGVPVYAMRREPRG